MNYRSRELLNLSYQLDCTLRIPGVCEGGCGEPCHANWQLWGKMGGGGKAPDWAIASGCRACHRAIDQGSKLSGELREHYWMRGHVETMNRLWERGLIRVARPTERGVPVVIIENGPAYSVTRNRKSRTTASKKTVTHPAKR